MNKYAGIHIPFGIDMKISSATGNASAHILSVILKINSEKCFRLSELTQLMIHKFSLLRRWQQFRNGIISNWHIMEIPYEECTPLNHLIIEFFAADAIQILTGVATGNSKADALYKSLYGPITPNVPASILQLHQDVTVVADEDALSLIKEKGLL